MNKKFSLHRVRPQDYETVEDLHTELFEGGKNEIPELDKGYWWLLCCGDDVAGFAGMHQSSQWHNVGYFCRAGILEEFQGHGLQKRLIRVRAKKARELGWVCLVTDTAKDNHASSNSLINCGFRLYTPSTKPLWAGTKSLYWRKFL